jgi:hypothetical protein
MASHALPHTDDRVIDQLLKRFWAEYADMPGLRLTSAQAQRLWSVDEGTCARILDALTAADLLVRGPDGQYARPGAGSWQPAMKMLKAELTPARYARLARAQSGKR